MLFAQVIPAVKMPRHFGALDYLVPEELESLVRLGSVVAVAWRNDVVPALVIGVSPEPSVSGVNIRQVYRLIFASPLADEYIHVILETARWSFASPATVLHAFWPTFLKKWLQTKEPIGPELNPIGNDTSTPPKREIRIYGNAKEKFAVINETVTAHLKSGGSILIVAPHQADVRAIANELSRDFPNEIAIIGSFGGAKAHREGWDFARSGARRLIIGTRQAVGVPILDLSLIIVTETSSHDLKQYDRNPRFDAREVAHIRAEASRANLLFIGAIERVEDHFLVINNGFQLIANTKTNKADVALINIVKASRENAPLSISVLESLEHSLQTDQKVLIFHNRRGSATAIACNDCFRPIRCRHCELPMRVNHSELRCYRCQETALTPAACPVCGGYCLRPIGLGAAAIEAYVKRKYPNKKTIRLDSDQEDRDDEKVREADIIVGTQMALHALLELPRFDERLGLIITVDTDDLLAYPGFRVTEQAWRSIQTIIGLGRSTGAKVLLETLDPDSPKLLKALMPPETFLPDEAAARIDAGYPPAADLVTVSTSATTEAEAINLLGELRHSLAAAARGTEASVSRPLRPQAPYRNGRWRSTLAIRRIKVGDRLWQVLMDLPEKFVIERDPESTH